VRFRAGFYVVWFGAYERGTGRIEIRFYGEIWRETVNWGCGVPHGKNYREFRSPRESAVFQEALFFRAPAPPYCLNSGSPEDRKDPVYLWELFKEVHDPHDLKTWLDMVLTLFFLLFVAIL